jgi:hypothetical protein
MDASGWIHSMVSLQYSRGMLWSFPDDKLLDILMVVQVGTDIIRTQN